MTAVRDHTTTYDPSAPGRLHELDALRGLAAVSVMLLHFKTFWTTVPEHPLSRFDQGLVNSLKFLYAGGEAVILFFVLSGLVLALPYFTGRAQGYPIYIVRRILRIYGPYLSAFVIALACAVLLGPRLVHRGAFATTWARPLQLRPILAHLMMIGQFDTRNYDFVIWSLVQEMRVSIFFPLLVFALRKLPTTVALGVAFLLSGLTIAAFHHAGSTQSPQSLLWTVHYTAFFILGILLARHLRAVRSYWHRLTPALRWSVGLICFGAYFGDGVIVGVLSRHLSRFFREGDIPFMLASWVASVGIVGIIISSISWEPYSRFLRSTVPQFLGRVSYSLYLLHPLVLLSIAALCYGHLAWWVQLVLYIVATLTLSWGFCVLVEERFIALSRSVGSRRGPASFVGQSSGTTGVPL